MDQITALILPYRKKLGQTHYLLHKELIPNWDKEMDMCGICIDSTLEAVETQILELLKGEFGYIGDRTDISSLGVCAGDRGSSNTFYLYAIDLTKAKISDPSLLEDSDKHFWASDDLLLESIDAQLITCYARTQFLLI